MLTVTYLIDEEVLPSIAYKHLVTGKKRTLVSHATLNEFLSKYITLGIMVNNAHTQAQHVYTALARPEVYPLDYPTEISKIYLRTQIPEKFL